MTTKRVDHRFKVFFNQSEKHPVVVQPLKTSSVLHASLMPSLKEGRRNCHCWKRLYIVGWSGSYGDFIIMNPRTQVAPHDHQVLMTADKAAEMGCTPLAKIVGYADGATDPIDFPIAPKFALDKLLAQVPFSVIKLRRTWTNNC